MGNSQVKEVKQDPRSAAWKTTLCVAHPRLEPLAPCYSTGWVFRKLTVAAPPVFPVVKRGGMCRLVLYGQKIFFEERNIREITETSEPTGQLKTLMAA